MKMKKMTSEKKHKITTIGLWLILILMHGGIVLPVSQ